MEVEKVEGVEKVKILTKSTHPERRQIELNKLDEIFSQLGDKFPFIIDYRTGFNFNEASHAWDFVIDPIFRNKADLLKYQDSEEHKEAIRNGSGIEKNKAVIDYEF